MKHTKSQSNYERLHINCYVFDYVHNSAVNKMFNTKIGADTSLRFTSCIFHYDIFFHFCHSIFISNLIVIRPASENVNKIVHNS